MFSAPDPEPWANVKSPLERLWLPITTLPLLTPPSDGVGPNVLVGLSSGS